MAKSKNEAVGYLLIAVSEDNHRFYQVLLPMEKLVIMKKLREHFISMLDEVKQDQVT